jgi:peptidoglycan/LPS O-acetylase OafA/YrhL
MKKDRIFALDGARGIAAFSVLLFHVLGSRFVNLSYLYIAVDFFFILSGFVLAPALSRVSNFQDVWNFLLKRFVRIFPMVLAIILFTATYDLIVMVKHWYLDEPRTDTIILSLPIIVISILMLQVFYKPAILVNYPIWSLSAEWIVNIIIATSNVFLKNGKYWSLIVGFGLVTISGVNGSELINQVGRAMWGFSIGLVIFEFRDRLFVYRKTTVFIISLIAPIYFLVPLLGNFQALFSVWSFAATIIYLYKFDTSKRLSRVCAVMGEYSYGFYLWHFPMLSTTGIILTSAHLNPDSFQSITLQIILCSVLSVVATKLSLIVFEKPIRNLWIKRSKLI